MSSLSARALQVYPVLSLRLVSAWMDGDKMQLEERFCRAYSVTGLRGCTDMLGAAVGGRSGARRCAPSRILLFCGPKEKRELGRAADRGFCARHGSARMCIYHLSTHLKGLT